jgi:DnaJ-class molecular chaperone
VSNKLKDSQDPVSFNSLFYTKFRFSHKTFISGSKYFNLNPYEVLQLETTATVAEIKTKYKRLSFIVHPDKNIDDKERAQTAFEIVNKAYKELEHDVTRNKCLEKYEEAEQKLNIMLAAKRKQLKKDGKSDILKEDQDPEVCVGNEIVRRRTSKERTP